MNNITSIWFDLGGVLMPWDPLPLITDLMPRASDAERKEMAGRIAGWNAVWNKGNVCDGVLDKSAEFPQYRDIIMGYSERWDETLGQPIQATVQIVEQLHALGYKLYAASNWSSDTFWRSRPRMPFLDLFAGITVSGDIGVLKPEPAFYQHMMAGYNLKPDEVLLTDDTAANLPTAQALGIATVLFQSPSQLAQELTTLGLLKACSISSLSSRAITQHNTTTI